MGALVAYSNNYNKAYFIISYSRANLTWFALVLDRYNVTAKTSFAS